MKYKFFKVIPVFLVLFALLAGCKAKETATLSLTQNSFKPGDAISVQYTALSDFDTNAWIGIIPSNIAHGNESVNDQHDIAYKYLNKSTGGTLTFTVPGPGSYDLRMHNTDTNGVEVASVSFTVEGTVQKQQASLALPKTTYTPGEQITVNFSAPGSYASNAWVGIIPSKISHGSESVNDQHDLSYQYLKKRTSGALTFHAPGTAGSYDFRMHDTDGNGIEVASVSFTVQ